MLSSSTSDFCIECGHNISEHFKNVIGQIKCLHTSLTTSTGGICGLTYLRNCDCTNYYSWERKKRDEKKVKDDKAFQEHVDAIIEDVLNAEK